MKKFFKNLFIKIGVIKKIDKSQTIEEREQELVKKVNDILLEPESIDTMIPPCKKCIHYKGYDLKSLRPDCIRPTGDRTIVNDYENGISSSIIDRIHRECCREREISSEKYRIRCGPCALFFKEKEIK